MIDDFFCLELNNCYCKNTTYFNALLKSLNNNTAIKFYELLINWDISKWNRNDIPMTKLKKELINSCLPLTERFMDDVISGEYEVKYLKNDKYRIHLQRLYDCFREWVNLNGHKIIINKTNFKNEICEKYKLKCKRIRIINNINIKVGFILDKLFD